MEKEEVGMKKGKSSLITGLLSVFGVLLIVGAVLLTVLQSVGQNVTAERNRDILEQMYALMPTVHSGGVDDRIDVSMPMLEINGEDFVGIIEIPLYHKQLPVYGSWSKHKVSSFPCRFDGNLYDGSLIIGGSDGAGQFDFMKNISIGDSVFLTDMTGGRYYYKVDWVELTSDATSETLASDTADMVLFARNSYSLDYTVVRCSLQARQVGE